MHARLSIALFLSLTALSAAWAEDLPSIQEVYATAHAGQLTQARAMVDRVIAAKPDSSKAHFVKAEICASQSDLTCVREELSSARRQDPGLSYADPSAVRNLEAISQGGTASRPAIANSNVEYQPNWLWIGLGLIALLGLAVFVMNRRSAQSQRYTGTAATDPSSPGQGTGVQQEGLGSRLAKGLATGAALGAGMVAGEALADGLMHHNNGPSPITDGPVSQPDLGGKDFGIRASQDDDWNNSSDISSADIGGSDW